MLTFEENPNFVSEMNAQLGQAMWDAGGEAENYLQVQMTIHSVTGVHWPSNPRRSSALGEYPQEQEGDLHASIGMRKTPGDNLSVDVGFFSEDLDKLLYLELYGAAQYGGREGVGRRQPLWMTFEGQNSTQVHGLMAAALQRNG